MHSYAKRFFIVLVVSVFGLLLSATRVNACSCGPRPTVLEAFEESEVVVIARIISVEKVSRKKSDSTDSDKEEEDDGEQRYVDDIRSATMVVNKVFKGKLKVRDEIVFGQGGGADCVWTFDEESVGDEVLLYLTTPETLSRAPYLPSKDPGLWFAFGCGRNRRLAGAIDDLRYLENMSKLQGKTRISGTLGGWNADDFPVAGKKIKLIGPKKTYETKTDKNGFFEIYDLPPGKYLVEPEIPAGWKVAQDWLRYSASVVRQGPMTVVLSSPNQVPIVLEPNRHASVDISFEIDNEVRGKVIGPTGKGM